MSNLAAINALAGAGRPVHRIGLLEADPDLGAGLTDDELTKARRHAALPAVELVPGNWRPDTLERVAGVQDPVHGFLVLEGTLTLDVRIARRTCVRLFGPGDLVLLDGVEVDSIASVWGWSVLQRTRLAIFDRSLLTIAQRWPALMSAIVTRAAIQTRHAHLQQAISQLPRVEDRVVALFWTLADRIGVTRSQAVFVPLTLTHDMIAQMVGARRPTVTLTLSSLAEQGLLVRQEDGWLVDRRSQARVNRRGPGAG